MASLAEGLHAGISSVTAIIPTYNRAAYVGQSISSLLGQSFAPTQVIVVDDGSQDHTREVVAQFAGRVEYLAKENGGKSTALNLAMGHAIGNLVWIFDDDDIAEPDALHKLVTALRENPTCGFAYGDYDLLTIDGNGQMRFSPASLPSTRPENLYLAVMERSFILQQGLLVRKECYDEVGGFDEALIRSQDLDMMLRLARRYAGVKVEGILFHLRQHAGIRGSAASPVSARRKVEGWVKSDRKIIGRIYATHNLQDFLPQREISGEMDLEQRVTSLLQRCCVLARKGMWKEAALDIGETGKIMQTAGVKQLSQHQKAILQRIFDLFSYAPHTFNEASEFRLALNQVRPKRLQRDIRAAVLWPLPFTIGAALVNREYENFRRFIGVYFALATPSAAVRTLFCSSFFNTGLALLKQRSASTAAKSNVPQNSKSLA
jgi:Glycosyl transferase family 2